MKVIKKYFYLFISLMLDILGLILLMVLDKNSPFPIFFLILGIIGTIASFILLIANKNKFREKIKEKVEEKEIQEVKEEKVEAEKPKTQEKSVNCKYCKGKYDKDLDSCPHCGAPNDNN